MNQPSPLPARSISLEQLIALSDEMAALSRAGVPLERGLVQLGADLPGRLGRIAVSLGQRLEAGESLARVFDDHEPAFPPLYRAVVEAGLRSGRLSVALEGLAASLRRVAELRRLVAYSLIYPLFVLALAYTLLVLTMVHWAPVMAGAFPDVPFAARRALDWMALLGETASLWAPWPPLAVLLFLVVLWYRSGVLRPRAGKRWRRRALSGRWPTLRGSLYTGRVATFAEVLALLVEQQVPLAEAVVLAADSSGDRVLQETTRELAERIRRGESSDAGLDVPHGFPPLLGWLTMTASRQPHLTRSLRHAADAYRLRALRMSDWMTVYLPILLSAGIGGAATLLYALSVFGPWVQMLYRLGQPP